MLFGLAGGWLDAFGLGISRVGMAPGPPDSALARWDLCFHSRYCTGALLSRQGYLLMAGTALVICGPALSIADEDGSRKPRLKTRLPQMAGSQWLPDLHPFGCSSYAQFQPPSARNCGSRSRCHSERPSQPDLVSRAQRGLSCQRWLLRIPLNRNRSFHLFSPVRGRWSVLAWWS
jgi:hypothetical protein